MDDEDLDPMVICCQGPPRCDLEGDEAIDAAVAGCPWCKRIIVGAVQDQIIQPGNA